MAGDETKEETQSIEGHRALLQLNKGHSHATAPVIPVLRVNKARHATWVGIHSHVVDERHQPPFDTNV